MIKIGGNSGNIIIIDTAKAIQLDLTRAEAKALARFLMVELNIVKFYLNDGRAGHELDKEFQELLFKRWNNKFD